MTAPAAANDRTTLYGVLAIVGAVCCWPVGLIFGILGFMEAKKFNKPPTLPYIAFGILAVFLVIDVILFSTGALSNMTG